MKFQKLRETIAFGTRLRRLRLNLKAARLFEKYQPFTMVGKPEFVANIKVAHQYLQNPSLSSGAIMECGCWRGGMSAALIELGGPDRDYYFFDSFEGLPPAREDLDGQRAVAYQADKSSPLYYDNCSASIEEFQQAIALARPQPSRVHTIEGFYEETLPQFVSPKIAVLRLDCDWYDSVMICLKTFWDSVLPGGLILIDDYYYWDGCSRAVHDFLSMNKATEKIQQGARGLAFIVKAAQE
jgi:O-methyltransferase